MATAAERAESTLRSVQAQATRVVDCSDERGRAAARRLLRVLREADRDLGDRLQREARDHGGMTARFTGAQALVYREQVVASVAYVEARLRGLTDAQAQAAIAGSLRHTGTLFEGLERAYRGVAAPTRLAQAAVLARAQRGVMSSRLRAHATSVDRYGRAMITEIERTMAVGMVGGLSQWEMVNALTGHGGPRGTVSMAATVRAGRVVRLREEEIPEGLFTRYRSWAWRIVRTETAHAYNAARIVGLHELREDIPDLQKKILAHFDNRTAYDSIVVHGQIRPLEGYFQDGAGRVYQRPPARPNDRETVIPWVPDWDENALTRQLTEPRLLERARAIGVQGGTVVREQRRRALATARRALERRRAAAEERNE